MKNINNNINKLINALDPNIKQCIGCKKWKNSFPCKENLRFGKPKE